MRNLNRKISQIIIVLFLMYGSVRAVGESAVITLVFPPGARATGLGETFTGIADDPEATFYNVAGLGQSPLANSWKIHSVGGDSLKITSISSKRKKGFGRKDRVWIGTDRGLRRYNGKVWESNEIYVIEGDENIRDVAEKLINVEDDALIQRAVDILKKTNRIDANRTAKIREILQPTLKDTITENGNFSIGELIDAILSLDEVDQNSTKIYGLIAAKVDSSAADSISEELVKIFKIEDVRFLDLVEIKVPFDIAVNEPVTALVIDESERLWAGTNNGLWNYDGTSWNYLTVTDGLPSNRINSVDISTNGELAVGTDRGLAVLSEGQWTVYGTQNGLPDSVVNTAVFAGANTLYVGTNLGLAQKKDSVWTVFDTSDGLLSLEVYTLLYDSERNLWIGGENGITIYNETAWKRFRFPESRVTCFAEYQPGKVWIGTNKGAVSYKAGRVKTMDDGTFKERPPTWKVFHSKNALKGDNVVGISVHGKDVWLVTDEAVNHYDRADMQFHFFWEPVLPAFELPDLWHMYTSFILPTQEWGTLGFAMNYLNFGVNTWTDEHGRELGRARSWEGVFSLCYGLPIKEDFSFGMNMKFINSALAPGYGEGSEGVGRTFAIDAAILKKNMLFDNLSLGFQISNMGPSIFYISREEADPIPFNLRLGLAYQIVQTPIHDLLVAMDFDREFVKNYPDKEPDPFYKALFTDLFVKEEGQRWWDKAKEEAHEIIGHVGIEYWYVHFIGVRLGYMHDEAGVRKELSIGLGLQYGNLAFDWSYINSPRGSVARNGQWRTSIFVRI